MSTQKMRPEKRDYAKWQNNALIGRRVQNSVFECILDNAQSIALKATLEDIIDTEKDSLRFYYLGNKYQTKIEHIGVDRGIAPDQTLIL